MKPQIWMKGPVDFADLTFFRDFNERIGVNSIFSILSGGGVDSNLGGPETRVIITSARGNLHGLHA